MKSNHQGVGSHPQFPCTLDVQVSVRFCSKTDLRIVNIWIISYDPHGQQVLQGATSQTLQPLQQVGPLSTLAVYNSMVNTLIADSCHEETTINIL